MKFFEPSFAQSLSNLLYLYGVTQSRTIIAALLALCLAVPANVFVQLAKVPALFAHFAQHEHDHHGQHPGFFELLALHYADEAHHDADHQEHGKLPFSGHQAPVQLTVSPALPFTQSFVACICMPVQVLHLTPTTDPPDSRSGPSVWQPPKIA